MAEASVQWVDGRLYGPYHNWYGAVASRFFRELRDKALIFGNKCGSCGMVFAPPRSVCPNCLDNIEEWVQLPGTGSLTAYTVVHYSYSDHCQPRKPPYALGIIRLDGAHTGLCHLLGEVELDEIRVGMKVVAVPSQERKGNILDIAYFKPLC